MGDRCLVIGAGGEKEWRGIETANAVDILTAIALYR
jgi:hypothetical protein